MVLGYKVYSPYHKDGITGLAYFFVGDTDDLEPVLKPRALGRYP
jgi:hypothetical protein